ncbi:MAG: IPT/TIG domain-containing protein [Acidobacteria bacterium]|nr:IPT/TIG domain-containing protein [Acidobacteriota bacterium]MBI3424624.1 IPT/TIG domain-containing protein [Acidobacteriota bacterium]
MWQAPVLEQVTRGGSYDLRWLFKDGNGGATVDLYYDMTGSGFAGTAIVTGLNATNGEMIYNWDVGALPDGLYYVYARFRNGEFSDAVYGGSVRKLTDTDGDGMPDAWETANGLNPNSDAAAYLEPDGDGPSNLDEYISNTNPRAADTDGGGESDRSEVTNGRDPLAQADDVTGVTVLAASPAQGDSRGGDQVMIVGSGFRTGATVSFGNVAATGVTFINSTKLLVTTPAGNIGKVESGEWRQRERRVCRQQRDVHCCG